MTSDDVIADLVDKVARLTAAVRNAKSEGRIEGRIEGQSEERKHSCAYLRSVGYDTLAKLFEAEGHIRGPR